jgi:hypothetical protein
MLTDGSAAKALALAERAIVLNPLDRPVRNMLAQAAVESGSLERAETVLRESEPEVAVEYWSPAIMGWIAQGDLRRAGSELREFAADADALARANGAAAAGPPRARIQELRELVSALSAGAAAPEALARRLQEKTRAATSESQDEHWLFYELRLPALSLLAGADRALDAWARRLDTMPPFGAALGTGSLHSHESGAWAYNAYFPGNRLVQRDPRFWTQAARFDPGAWGLPSMIPWTQDPSRWPPDFCRAPSFPYDCTRVAREAFAAADRARQARP